MAAAKRNLRVETRGVAVLSSSRVRAAAGLLLCVLAVAACAPEKRQLTPTSPLSDPTGPTDPRAALFEHNSWRVSEGGLYFTLYGCGSCHGGTAKGVLALDDDSWRYGGSLRDVFLSIADGRAGGMPAYRSRMPQEQLWQVTTYVRQLHKMEPAARRRQDADQQGQPTGDTWNGALR